MHISINSNALTKILTYKSSPNLDPFKLLPLKLWIVLLRTLALLGSSLFSLSISPKPHQILEFLCSLCKSNFQIAKLPHYSLLKVP